MHQTNLLMLPEKEEGKKKKFCYLQKNLIYAPCCDPGKIALKHFS